MTTPVGRHQLLNDTAQGSPTGLSDLSAPGSCARPSPDAPILAGAVPMQGRILTAGRVLPLSGQSAADATAGVAQGTFAGMGLPSALARARAFAQLGADLREDDFTLPPAAVTPAAPLPVLPLTEEGFRAMLFGQGSTVPSAPTAQPAIFMATLPRDSLPFGEVLSVMARPRPPASMGILSPIRRRGAGTRGIEGVHPTPPALAGRKRTAERSASPEESSRVNSFNAHAVPAPASPSRLAAGAAGVIAEQEERTPPRVRRRGAYEDIAPSSPSAMLAAALGRGLTLGGAAASADNHSGT